MGLVCFWNGLDLIKLIKRKLFLEFEIRQAIMIFGGDLLQIIWNKLLEWDPLQISCKVCHSTATH